MLGCWFFFQAEDGIRDLVRSRGLGDVYKRQGHDHVGVHAAPGPGRLAAGVTGGRAAHEGPHKGLSLIHI